MEYIICCDFASLKCSHFEFASKLKEFTTHYTNVNNYTWIIEINPLEFIPYNPDNMCESIYMMLCDFLVEDSFFMILSASESFSSDTAHEIKLRSRSVSDL